MTKAPSKESISYTMSQIKGKNTKPELLVRKFLFANGFRYRLHHRNLPGTPDIILTKYKTVVMVNGCFWHGHKGCDHFVLPKTKTEWWLHKIKTNQKRDQLTNVKLNVLGWKVITVWECELKKKKMERSLERILELLVDRNK